jgi:RHS repeat-associated protein
MTTREGDGTAIYTPFPDYELEDPPGANNDTTRTTYRLAGQMVGVRVKTPTGNTFYYPFTDHLGNVVAMSWRGAGVVANSHARYDPYGNFRTTPTATNPSLTSRGFTGHAHNNTGVYPTQNVGLIYMNARYYLPEIGRFISADTIVPDPTNPQSHNRYAYALNSPVSYTDTTGHCVEPVTATVVCIPTALVVGAVLTVAYVGVVVADLVSPTFNPRDDLADAATDALTELYDNIKYAASGDNGDVTGSEEVKKSLGGAGSASPNPEGPNWGDDSRWRVGDSIDKPLRNGNSPSWTTVRSRYWQNRAASAQPEEFSAQNLDLMKNGDAPQARVLVRDLASNREYIRIESKELHHIGGRRIPGANSSGNLRELWPWEHAQVDPRRHIGYELLQILQ